MVVPDSEGQAAVENTSFSFVAEVPGFHENQPFYQLDRLQIIKSGIYCIRVSRGMRRTGGAQVCVFVNFRIKR